ncbi:helix-turn-helix domain-containing protein [Tenacibaculum aiptasiae]|uniref:helix-turn-helix domain-containing protein n=1 Tax=Tenacibaculum aiptasiae TaxID=426481 RepID=UPI00232D6A7F|nr:helix-turn-helix transcriptional regulator [Tenacibaculum aiptasiae]
MTKGERLKFIIKSSGFTNKAFAEKAGVNANYISMLIKERQNMSGNFLMNLKKIIPDVNLDWLETGNGEPYIKDNLNTIKSGDTEIEVDKIVDIIIDGYDKFLNNKKFKVLLDNYSNKKLMEYIKDNN